MKRGVISVSLRYLRLPEGTRAVEAVAEGDTIHIVIEHEGLPDLPESATLPLLEPRFERNAADRLYMSDWGYDPRRSWQRPTEENRPPARKKKAQAKVEPETPAKE